MRHILLIPVVLLAFVPCNAHAQWLFKKQAPRVPAQRVPELIQSLRTDPDERKRSAAVDELRDYDAKAFPQIVPSLVEAALRDSKHGVRSDALAALSRVRPVSPVAGQALEYAAANDSHWPNRIQAKSALLRYQWAGYTPGSNEKNPPTPPATDEPATAARPQPNNLPPIVSVPTTQTPATAMFPQAPPAPRPQFPTAAPNYPTPNQNPLAVAPTIKVPTSAPPMSNPLISAPSFPRPSVPAGTNTPPANVIPMPPVYNVQTTPIPSVPIPSVPIVVAPAVVPEPNLQFRPVINEPSLPAVPQREIPLIDLNPVLTNTPTRMPPPVAPLPNVNTINPPVIVIPPANGGNLPLPVPADAPPLPTPLPKI